MESFGRYFVVVAVAVLFGCVFGLQRPPPRYSQQYMPETSFTCRNKIVGSYYADPETDCQVFHVCVSVAGSIQDYKFLCPNDTAFDQESQTCADWYDVDCEAATLYYASDNFDLYRIGSGLESPHYDSIRSDAEPQDHLQRSETSDPVRSSANTLNRVSSSNYNGNNNNNKDVLRGSSSSNFYNRNGKEDYDGEKSSFKDAPVPEAKKKTGVRKVSRKQQYDGPNANDYAPSSTASPSSNVQNSYTNNNYYSGNIYDQRQNSYASSTTARPQENYNSRTQNVQRYNQAPSSTYKPDTTYQGQYNNYQSPTTARTTIYNSYKTNNNNNNNNNNYDQSTSYSISTTLRPPAYTNNANTNNGNKNYQSYDNSQFAQSTTVQPSTNYAANDYTNYQQRNYNNVQRSNGNSFFQSTTASTVYDNNYNGNNYNANYNSNANSNYNANNNNYNNNNSNNNYSGNFNGNSNGQYRNAGTSTRQEVAQTTSKYFATHGSFAPTTYSPATKKFVNDKYDGSSGQTLPAAPRGNNDRFNTQSTDGGQFYDKTAIKSSTQYHDSTKAPKKATQFNSYDNSNAGKYFEASTSSYDLGKSPAGIGFSPASINRLAETPRSTTPVPRRASSVTTYNPSTFNANTQRPPSPTTTRGSTYVSGAARPFSSTTLFASTTTPRPKSGKKNDYDYAYYDNTGPLEYDGVDLEHVTGNKESTKIARN